MVKIETISHLHELLRHIENSLEAAPGSRWFRGSGSYNKHRLMPSLFRHADVTAGRENPATLEQRLKSRFSQTSPPFLADRPATALDWLFTQQHYGIPTRLLDWSVNPFVALYFALSSTRTGEEACIWVLDPLRWNQKSLNNPHLERILDPTDTATARFMDSIGDDLDARADPVAVYSNHINPRIVAQRGTFTIFGRGQTPMEELSYAKDCLECFVIEEALKAPLYATLLSIGYTHSVIYPDLAGLGTELKTLFGF